MHSCPRSSRLTCIAVGLCALVVAAGCSSGRASDDAVPLPTPDTMALTGDSDWSLVFFDDFDDRVLDPTRWRAETGDFGVTPDGPPTQQRDQCYTDDPANVAVADGLLTISAVRAENDVDRCDDTGFTSGFVVSIDPQQPEPAAFRGSEAWTYGRFEFRARFPDAAGFWPAIWLRPLDQSFGPWPASGEIDIAEYPGPSPLPPAPSRPLHTAAFWSKPDGRRGNSVNDVIWDAAQATDWHVYTFEWEPDRMRWYLDGELTHELDLDDVTLPAEFEPQPGAPFDRDFFLTINLQVNGWAGDPDSDVDGASMDVDWVRVYEAS